MLKNTDVSYTYIKKDAIFDRVKKQVFGFVCVLPSALQFANAFFTLVCLALPGTVGFR